MKFMYHRAYDITHGRDGFNLRVADEWVPGIVAEKVVFGVLSALGHPCCDRGPLRTFGITHADLWRRGFTFGRLAEDDHDIASDDEFADEDIAPLFWHRVLHCPNRLVRRGRQIVSLPLTREQAIAIRPDVAEWGFASEEVDDTDMSVEEFDRLMDEGEPVDLLTERPKGER